MSSEPSSKPRRRVGLAPFLLVVSTLCFIMCVIGFVFLLLPSTQRFKTQLQIQAEKANYPTFLAPGSIELELPAGMIWVSFFTDHALEGARYQVPASLRLKLALRDASGHELPVQTDAAQQTEIPSDDGEIQTAVLVGIAEIPADGTYVVELSQEENLSNKAVAQIITMTANEKEQIATVLLYLGFGVCGGAGAVFFGGLGLGAAWMKRRFDPSAGRLIQEQR